MDDSNLTKGLAEKIERLQDQVNSLQQRVIHLENQIIEKKGNLTILSEAFKRTVKAPSNRQDYTLEVKKDDSSIPNQRKVKEEIHKLYKVETDILSDAPNPTLKGSSQSQQ